MGKMNAISFNTKSVSGFIELFGFSKFHWGKSITKFERFYSQNHYRPTIYSIVGHD